jgi:hypothetical protein
MDFYEVTLLVSIYFVSLGVIGMILHRSLDRDPKKMTREELDEWLIYRDEGKKA